MSAPNSPKLRLQPTGNIGQRPTFPRGATGQLPSRVANCGFQLSTHAARCTEHRKFDPFDID
jgi:hypothetical protein